MKLYRRERPPVALANRERNQSPPSALVVKSGFLVISTGVTALHTTPPAPTHAPELRDCVLREGTSEDIEHHVALNDLAYFGDACFCPTRAIAFRE